MAGRAKKTEGRRLLEWVEQVASFCADEWGMAPITGRIFGWLMICEPAEQSAGEIAEAIGASRASLTSNMRLLMSVGLVRKHRRPGERTTYFRIDDHAWRTVIQRKLLSLSRFGDIAAEGTRIAGGTGADTARVRDAQRTSSWLAELATRNPPRDDD